MCEGEIQGLELIFIVRINVRSGREMMRWAIYGHFNMRPRRGNDAGSRPRPGPASAGSVAARPVSVQPNHNQAWASTGLVVVRLHGNQGFLLPIFVGVRAGVPFFRGSQKRAELKSLNRPL